MDSIVRARLADRRVKRRQPNAGAVLAQHPLTLAARIGRQSAQVAGRRVWPATRFAPPCLASSQGRTPGAHAGAPNHLLSQPAGRRDRRIGSSSLECHPNDLSATLRPAARHPSPAVGAAQAQFAPSPAPAV